MTRSAYHRMFEEQYKRTARAAHKQHPYWVEHDGDVYPFDSSEEARKFCQDFDIGDGAIRSNPEALAPNPPPDFEGI